MCVILLRLLPRSPTIAITPQLVIYLYSRSISMKKREKRDEIAKKVSLFAECLLIVATHFIWSLVL